MNILTKDALNHILDTYETLGPAAARELAPGYGINPKYVRKLACVHGVKAKRKGWRVRREDPRWQWARERGAVLA